MLFDLFEDEFIIEMASTYYGEMLRDRYKQKATIESTEIRERKLTCNLLSQNSQGKF